eukprot:355172-Chlamydomonas_euryale.AAC.2
MTANQNLLASSCLINDWMRAKQYCLINDWTRGVARRRCRDKREGQATLADAGGDNTRQQQSGVSCNVQAARSRMQVAVHVAACLLAMGKPSLHPRQGRAGAAGQGAEAEVWATAVHTARACPTRLVLL